MNKSQKYVIFFFRIENSWNLPVEQLLLFNLLLIYEFNQ